MLISDLKSDLLQALSWTAENWKLDDAVLAVSFPAGSWNSFSTLDVRETDEGSTAFILIGDVRFDRSDMTARKFIGLLDKLVYEHGDIPIVQADGDRNHTRFHVNVDRSQADDEETEFPVVIIQSYMTKNPAGVRSS